MAIGLVFSFCCCCRNSRSFFQTEEEKSGQVNIYWRMEGIRDDYFKYLAHLEMMDYLSKGVSSPIQKVCQE